MKPLLAIPLAFALAFAAACSDGGGDDTGVTGDACGGRTGVTCAAGEYCDFTSNRCGTDDATGVCRPRPTSCPALLVPERTCGCDQQVYGSPCEAMLSGTDLNAGATCPLETGAFACGFRQCKKAGEYCQREASDIAGTPDDYKCNGVPLSCGGTASCSCLSGQACGAQCSGDAASGVTLICPGG